MVVDPRGGGGAGDDEQAAALLEAEVQLALGRPSEARAVLRKALVGAPDDPRLLSLLAEAVVGDDAAAAVRLARAAIAADPAREHAHRMLARALVEAGKPKDAVPPALEAVRLAPDRADPLAALAFALAGSGDIRGAIAAAGRAVEIEPASTSGWFAQGVIALRGHQWPVAEANFRRVLSLDPDHAAARDHLEQAIRQQGRDLDLDRAFGVGRAAAAPPPAVQAFEAPPPPPARERPERAPSDGDPGRGRAGLIGVRVLFVAVWVLGAASLVGRGAAAAVLAVAALGGVVWWLRGARRPRPVLGDARRPTSVDRGERRGGWASLAPELRGSLLAGGATLAVLFLLAAITR